MDSLGSESHPSILGQSGAGWKSARLCTSSAKIRGATKGELWPQNGRCLGLQDGSLPVISRVITPFIGVITPVVHL